MSVNLLRNSKVYFTTNVDTAAPNIGKINTTGFNSSIPNCWEIQVLDDLSFNQTTAVETIAVNETGAAPIRGQRTFNTALNPVDFNFTTYMRPYQTDGGGALLALTVTLVGGANAGTMVADNTNLTNYSLEYGLNTRITVAAPVGGRAAILYPVFGTDSSLANYNKLVGFKIADGGKGYGTGPVTLTISVFDPDSGAESTESFTITSTTTASTVTVVDAEESVLWNAMFSRHPIGTAPTAGQKASGAAWTKGSGSNPAVCQLVESASHQLQRFGIIVVFDQNVFLLDDCSLNTATIDFGIDAIASIQWSGQARTIRRLAAPTDAGNTWSGTLTGSYVPKVTTAPFIANKLSTVSLVSKIGNYGSAPNWAGAADGTGKTYQMPLTGGSITLTNNITYLTPAYMGAINQPITYFTGSRSVTGSLTAYLRTGTGSGTNNYSANLFSDLIAQVNTDSDPEFYLQVEIGGASNNVKVELAMPGAVLTIPTINAESVITTTVNFTAQGNDSGKFDILQDNEIMVKYFA
jgi:hypothetical protein